MFIFLRCNLLQTAIICLNSALLAVKTNDLNVRIMEQKLQNNFFSVSLLVESASVAVENCAFEGNSAKIAADVIVLRAATATFISCQFSSTM